VLRFAVLSSSLLVGDGVALALMLACDVDVDDDAVVAVGDVVPVVVEAVLLEDVDDACFTHSIGDHEARATAVKVSVGGDPSQP
jgi:hypothetical protein